MRSLGKECRGVHGNPCLSSRLEISTTAYALLTRTLRAAYAAAPCADKRWLEDQHSARDFRLWASTLGARLSRVGGLKINQDEVRFVSEDVIYAALRSV